MDHLAFLFPGQGSQYSGMLDCIPDSKKKNEFFSVFSEEMNRSIDSFSDSEITQTQNTQPLLYTISACYFEWCREKNLIPSFMAGHSLGEFSALYAANVFSFRDGLRLTAYRGKIMQNVSQKTPGGMCAIIGLELPAVLSICKQCSEFGIAEAVNINAKKQIVISGENAAMEKAPEFAKKEGARMCIPLKVSAPFHSSLMKSLETEFTNFMQTIQFHDASIPVIQNVDAQPHMNAQRIQWNIVQQLFHPVRWTDTLSMLCSKGIKNAIEMGPKNVLTGLSRGTGIRCKPVESVCKEETTDM